MELIKKLNQNLKINKLISNYSNYAIEDFESLQVKINKLREIFIELSNSRGKHKSAEREKLILHLFRVLDYIDVNYSNYLGSMKDLNDMLKNTTYIKLSASTNKKIAQAHSTKSELIKNFVTIYKNFKSLAKGFDDIPMKAILTRMQDCFNFNTNNENKSAYI